MMFAAHTDSPLLLDPSDAQNPWQALSYTAFNHLIKEYENGFANTKHALPFPKEVFQVERDIQVGDVFQRALIADTLLDFDDSMQIIQGEAEYLIDCRRKTGVGGWSYFPDLPELPPDADDLAQVMQVLLRAGYGHMGKVLFDEPLNILLNQQQNDTAWETWIIPKHHQNAEQQLQTVWVNKAWGTGSDIEVIANLMYALILYDRERFASAINRGISFLLTAHEHYRWNSTWYYGQHYGTYTAVRALCAAGVNHSIIEHALEAIEQSREPNGSWSIEGQGSSPLQTALALCTLSIGKAFLGQKLNKHWLQTSADYLLQTADGDSWPASPFIQMPMGRPYGFVHTILTYESSAITSNYVAKACHHIHQHHF